MARIGLLSDRWHPIAWPANWEIGRAWADEDVIQPALLICGAADPVLSLIGADWETRLRSRVHDLRGIAIVPDAGHLVQQEQPDAFNRELIAFLAQIRPR
ncbi:alpha/beta fold hydrolase [Sphingomonas sp. MMS24-JH45]